MCHRGNNSLKTWRVASCSTVAKIAFILIIVCYVQCSEGTNLRAQTIVNKKKISACLNYGHSCWGAHGKRASQLVGTPERQDVVSDADIPADLKWFVSRLTSGYKGSEPIGFSTSRKMFRDGQLEGDSRDLTQLLRSISDYDDAKDQKLRLPYQDDSKLVKDNQLYRFLRNNEKFEDMSQNNN